MRVFEKLIMILPIYQYGHKVLRQPSVEIDASYPNLKELIENMWDTMYKAEGCGLAAPQIGLNIRLFVVDANELVDSYPECAGFKKVFINAEIIEESEEEMTFREGCLSLPGISEEVKRPKTIRIKYLDENLEQHDEVISGVNAICTQHEYDHIEGHVFIDHVGPLRRRILKNKLTNISKGKAGAHYRVALP